MQRMLLISTMLILVAPNCLASPDEPSSAEEFAQRGQERIQKGEYEKSIADLTEAINLDPDRNYYVMRACVWELAKKYDKAIADCDVAIKGNPRDPTPYVFRGMAWTEKNEIEKAVDDFDMAIKLDPKNAAAYRSRANAWRGTAIIGRPGRVTKKLSNSIRRIRTPGTTTPGSRQPARRRSIATASGPLSVRPRPVNSRILSSRRFSTHLPPRMPSWAISQAPSNGKRGPATRHRPASGRIISPVSISTKRTNHVGA